MEHAGRVEEGQGVLGHCVGTVHRQLLAFEDGTIETEDEEGTAPGEVVESAPRRVEIHTVLAGAAPSDAGHGGLRVVISLEAIEAGAAVAEVGAH